MNKETSSIVLNTAKLDLGEVTLRSESLQDVQTASSRDFDTENERGIFSFAKPLPANAKARLSVSYKGELTGDMLGYYRSSGGKDGELKYTLTQFEVVTSISNSMLAVYLASNSQQLLGGPSPAGTSPS